MLLGSQDFQVFVDMFFCSLIAVEVSHYQFVIVNYVKMKTTYFLVALSKCFLHVERLCTTFKLHFTQSHAY